MAFDALEVSIQLNREVSEICGKLKKRSATLAKQLERATTSVALNVAEGSGTRGRRPAAPVPKSRTGARRKCTRFCGWRWRGST